MKSLTSLLLATLAGVQTVMAQDAIPYTDQASGIVFNTWAPSPQLTFGLTLPSNALTTDATEFIGMITCQGKGWCGISVGGGMNENLLILAYPQDGAVLTSLRWAENYQHPAVYEGDAKLTQVSSVVNSTHYSIIFRCQNCFQWQQGTSEVRKVSTSEGFLVPGWCFASSAPTGGSCPDTLTVRQHDSQGLFGAPLDDAVVHSEYSAWAAKATKEVTGNCGGKR
ncbi:hypothetical protein V8F20_009728 [Naviculisporaceae sp. PSN 640]